MWYFGTKCYHVFSFATVILIMVSNIHGTGIVNSVIDLGLDKEATFWPTHQNLEGHLKN